MDLKSSNGTFLNDKNLKPQKENMLESGDIIYILDVEILFEIRNTALEQQLVRLKPPPLPVKVPAQQPHTPNLVPVPYAPPPLLPDGAPNLIAEGEEEETGESYQGPSTILKNKKGLLYGSIALILCLVFLLPENKNKTEQVKEPIHTQNVGPLAGLSAQQQELVKETYQLAQQMYTQGKFEQCQSEIKQLHKYINSYKQSKDLEVQCVQAADYQIKRLEIEQKNKKAKQMEEFIQKITDRCQTQFPTFTLKALLLDCLAPAMELSPADSRIQVLIEQFDAKEFLKEEKRRKAAQRKATLQSILKKYTQSKKLHEEGKIEQAMTSYKKFIKISPHKELEETREQAERELASITADFNENIEKLNIECQTPFNTQQLKEAYYVCRKASKAIPASRKENILSIMEQAKNQLQIRMKPFYEEASINESLGNITTAKDYWKKIIQQDIDTGVYYQKAKVKLSNYSITITPQKTL